MSSFIHFKSDLDSINPAKKEVNALKCVHTRIVGFSNMCVITRPYDAGSHAGDFLLNSWSQLCVSWPRLIIPVTNVIFNLNLSVSVLRIVKIIITLSKPGSIRNDNTIHLWQLCQIKRSSTTAVLF